MLDATVFSLFSPQATAQAFAFALDLGLKSLALCAAALVLDRLLGRRVLARSTALNACLLGLVLLPAAALVFPQLRLNLASQPAVAESAPPVPQSDFAASPLAPQDDSALSPAPLSPFAGRKDAVSPSETRQNAEPRSAAAPAARPFDWRAVALLSYAAAALAASIRLSRSLVAVARLRRSGTRLTQPDWLGRLAHWQARLGVARDVELRANDRIDVPLVVGWRRPAILVPERLTAADRKTIDAILLHELAHVRRADYAWNLLLRLLQALYWPNPLVWFVGRSLSRVREQACDEICIHWLGGAEDYRTTLVELAGSLLRRPLAALGMAMAGSSRLQRRLEQLGASRGRPDCLSGWHWRVAALAVVASLAGALGALRFTNRAAAELPERAPVTVEKEASSRAENAEPRERKEEEQPAAPAAEKRKEQAQPSEKPAPSKASNASAPLSGPVESTEPIKVRVEKVRREDFIVQTTQPGTLKPARSMELYARVAGLIVARNVNVGDVVKAGQVLAEIDAPELDAELEQAKALADVAPADVEQAQGRLDEAAAGLEGADAELNKCEADLKQAESQLESAERRLKSLQAFKDSPTMIIPQRQLIESEAQVQTARGAIDVAKAQLAAAKAKVKQAQAAVAVAKAGLRIAQLHLAAGQQALKRVEQRAAYRQIAAPADGVVLRQAAEPGSLAKLGGEPLFVISGTNVVTMQAQIPERDALRVQPGQHAQVWLDAEPNGKPHDGKVSRVGYAIDPKTRTMPVEIDLPNRDGRLRPGMYGKVAIDLETHRDVLTTTGWAFRYDGVGFSRCYRVVDGRAVETKVTSVGNSTDRKEISGELSEGDVIIVEVLQSGTESQELKDGVRVEIVEDGNRPSLTPLPTSRPARR